MKHTPWLMDLTGSNVGIVDILGALGFRYPAFLDGPCTHFRLGGFSVNFVLGATLECERRCV